VSRRFEFRELPFEEDLHPLEGSVDDVPAVGGGVAALLFKPRRLENSDIRGCSKSSLFIV